MSKNEHGFYRLDQILELIPISKSQWWLWVDSGKAPKPVKLGPRTTAWQCSEIHALIDKFCQTSV